MPERSVFEKGIFRGGGGGGSLGVREGKNFRGWQKMGGVFRGVLYAHGKESILVAYRKIKDNHIWEEGPVWKKRT